MKNTVTTTLILLFIVLAFPFSSFATTNPLLAGTILFSSNRTGSWNIFRKNIATGYTENLTNSLSDNLNPQVSPDKKYIIFYSNRYGNNQIYQMNLSTLQVIRLTSNNANEYDPQYSPNGKLITFKSNLSDGRGDVWIMNSDGSYRRNLTPSLKSTEEWNPTFSRDSSKIYFVSGLQAYSEIRVVSATAGDLSGVYGLTFNSIDDWYPTVNPVTEKLVIVGKESVLGNDALFTLNANGTARIRLTNFPGDSNDPAWSKDGKRILFVNNQYGSYDLYIMNADGGSATLIDYTVSSELCPIFL